MLKGEPSEKVKVDKDADPNDDDAFMGLTTSEITLKRTEIVDKAVIAAVKTIAELARASDL